MVFRLLRRFLADNEFLETRKQLQEARRLLARYEATLRVLEERESEAATDSDKVDPDFLALIWAFLGVLVYFVSLANRNLLTRIEEAVNNAAPSMGFPFTIVDGVWLFVYLVCIYLLIANIAFGIRLIREYAKQKSNLGYGRFAKAMVSFIGAYVVWNVLFLIGTVTKWLWGF
jgi:hypothetical protein